MTSRCWGTSPRAGRWLHPDMEPCLKQRTGVQFDGGPRTAKMPFSLAQRRSGLATVCEHQCDISQIPRAKDYAFDDTQPRTCSLCGDCVNPTTDFHVVECAVVVRCNKPSCCPYTEGRRLLHQAGPTQLHACLAAWRWLALPCPTRHCLDKYMRTTPLLNTHAPRKDKLKGYPCPRGAGHDTQELCRGKIQTTFSSVLCPACQQEQQPASPEPPASLSLTAKQGAGSRASCGSQLCEGCAAAAPGLSLS
ncbi:hypothetical protein V8C86DRAFT_3035119 [Haematococcus lacustris]